LDTTIKLTINDNQIQAHEGDTVLDAALHSEIYIPHLCSHPDLPPLECTEGVKQVFQGQQKFTGNAKNSLHEGCKLCVVQINNDANLVTACTTHVKPGMIIQTANSEIKNYQKQRIAKILENHPHACLTCAQREGCSREPCSSNVPLEERCCPLLGNCELEKVSDHIGIPNYTKKYTPQHRKTIDEEPLINRDYELCIGCTRCIRACSDLRGVGVLGYTYIDDKRIIGTLEKPYLTETDCRFCGACIEVCPTGALTDKKIVPGKSREENLVPCKYTCPLQTNVPQYIRYINNQQYSKALAVILEQTPFPSVLGRVCFHPCELECRRSEINESVAICALKRFASDQDDIQWEGKIINRPSTGKKIAVIGAGPAGLTAAYFLTRKGHEVEVYEESKEIGGLLRTTLPQYRLPESILERDLQIIRSTGMQIHTEVVLDNKPSAMLRNGFSSVFIAIGSQLGKHLEIPGSTLNEVHNGIDFLKAVNEGSPPLLGKNPIVIGGGGVAIDVALTLLRLVGQPIQLVCLESRSEMPAKEWEIKEALEEGILIHNSWGPKKILEENGKVSGVDLIQCTSVFNEQRLFSPQFDKSLTKSIHGDMVILAIGQTSDLSTIADSSLEITRENTIKVDAENLSTSIPGVFAGGEVASGPSSVVDAINAGRSAAISIDKFLGGDGDIFIPLVDYKEKEIVIGRIEGFSSLSRIKMEKLEVQERLSDFKEIEQGYSSDEAINEARRCLQCDLRLDIQPIYLPPEAWVKMDPEEIKDAPDTSGVVQILNQEKEVLFIQGAISIQQALLDALDSLEDAHYFLFEEDEMYTKRESELLQQFLQKNGSLPRGNTSELDDDLF
jgi:NADPH-dependent glutamate synthase beta subunit-like oxidoreductase